MCSESALPSLWVPGPEQLWHQGLRRHRRVAQAMPCCGGSPARAPMCWLLQRKVGTDSEKDSTFSCRRLDSTASFPATASLQPAARRALTWHAHCNGRAAPDRITAKRGTRGPSRASGASTGRAGTYRVLLWEGANGGGSIQTREVCRGALWQERKHSQCGFPDSTVRTHHACATSGGWLLGIYPQHLSEHIHRNLPCVPCHCVCRTF